MKIISKLALAFTVLALLFVSCKKDKPEPTVEEAFVRLKIRKNLNPNIDGYIIESGRVSIAIVLDGVNGKAPEIILQKAVSFNEDITFTIPKRQDGWYTIVATNTDFLINNSATGIVSADIETIYKYVLPIRTKTPYFISREVFNTHDDIPLGYNYWDFQLTSPYLYKTGDMYSKEK